MLQIDPVLFVGQAVALFGWVLLAAAIYSAVEKVVDPEQGHDKP